MKLRNYQQLAIDEVFEYWRKGGENPLIEMATGTGKSLIIAALQKTLIEQHKDFKIIVLTHTRELVSQNYNELLSLWPAAPAGINSAGLGRRDTNDQILIASIQSVSNYPKGHFGKRDLIIIDEAHRVPAKDFGMYRDFIKSLRQLQPDLRVLGLTATPYRLDSGRLDDSDDGIFNKIVYSYDIAAAIDDDWLVPLVARSASCIIDDTNVRCRGGEFIGADLELASQAIIDIACSEIIEKGLGRKSGIIFCPGISHSYQVRDKLRSLGESAEAITSKTKPAERNKILERFKNGEISFLTNSDILTTGFNCPNVDLIVMLRPTLSTSLFVQMLGRGTRKAEGKKDCLVLDFTNNTVRHGPVDSLNIRKRHNIEKIQRDSKNGKVCPRCSTIVGSRSFVCKACDYEWQDKSQIKHNAYADENAVFLTREIEDKWYFVSDINVRKYEKSGKPLSLLIEYLIGRTAYFQWLTLEYSGYSGSKAREWWSTIFGTASPGSVDQAIKNFPKSHNIIAIQIRRNDRHWNVVGWRIQRADGSIAQFDERLKSQAVNLPVAAE